MDNRVILVTPDELRAYINEAVEALIPKLSKYYSDLATKKPKEHLTLAEASEYLAELGIPTARSTIYNLTLKGIIPRRKIGRSNVYSRQELQEWVESRTYRPEDKKRR